MSLMVSTSIPRNIRHAEGASHLGRERGRLRVRHDQTCGGIVSSLTMMLDDQKANPDIVLTSDTSGCWGSLWFQFEWSEALSSLHITNKESIPIALAAATWGAKWQNMSVLCRCNNAAAVHIINSGTSSDPYTMALIRCVHFITARFNIALSAVHLPDSENALTDALSRNNPSQFFLYNPQASRHPQSLMQLSAS